MVANSADFVVTDRKTRTFTFGLDYEGGCGGSDADVVELRVTYNVLFVTYRGYLAVYVYVSRGCGGVFSFRINKPAISYSVIFDAYKRVRRDFFEHCDEWVRMDYVGLDGSV